jgi:hypothetical protein
MFRWPESDLIILEVIVLVINFSMILSLIHLPPVLAMCFLKIRINVLYDAKLQIL